MSLFKKSDVSGLPKAFGGSAFIAFHGSWNRAPYPQEGYNVVVQPFKDGRPSGTFVVFADGFAGAVKQPGKAAHRPSGLAVGPDGAVYITDDVHGRIWRVTFQGDTTATVIEPAPPPIVSRADAASSDELPPEGIHPDAGEQVATLPTPPGATSEEWHLGVVFSVAWMLSAGGAWMILGDGMNQAADLASGVTSIPSWNLTPWMTFGTWFRPCSLRQVFDAAITSLKTMRRTVACDNAPFIRAVRCLTVANTLSMGFVVRVPVISGKVEERLFHAASEVQEL